MSLSIGGFHPGYTHPGSMGVTSAQDFYASHYQTHVAASAAYPDYDVTGERSYWQNWVLSGMAEVPVAPVEPTYSGVCSTPSPNSVCQNQLGYTENGHSLNQWQNYQLETQVPPLSEMRHYDTYTNSFGEKCYRRRTSANKKERRRTVSINNAFTNLRGSIPNVPSDTKLSKIKTLRLAISYISYLNEVLEKGDEKLAQTGFKADISRKRERRTEATTEGKKLCTSDACDSDDSSGSSISSNTGEGKKGRTGWPQHVWASELKSSPQ